METLAIGERECWAVECGLLPYEEACELQYRLVAARKADAVPDVLLLCEHPHVITLGRNGHQEHLLASQHLLHQMNVQFYPTDRGGDITYHGPGQIVCYPIFDLTTIRRDVAWYLRQLEEVMISVTDTFGIEATRNPGMTGVWVERSAQDGMPPTAEKLAAIGVHLSRWVTSHGFAYNVSTDLRYFDLIVPCGLHGKRATSLEAVLGRTIDCKEVLPILIQRFGEIFCRKMQIVSHELLDEALRQQEAPVHATV